MDEPKTRRGWVSLYALAFALLLVAGLLFVVASLGHLESLRLLRVSALVSGAAIALAIASVALPRRR